MSMTDVDQMSSLIGDVYDAALDSTQWPAALGKIRRFIGGRAATLFMKDVASKSGNYFHQDGGIEPHYIELYFGKYVKLDPCSTGHFFARLEEPVATADLIPYEEFLETRFYKEWAKPQAFVDFVGCTLDKSATSAAMVGVFRHERDGIVDDEARQRMRLIVPHIRRAVLIGRVIDLKTAEAATFADTLDGLSAGMFLVDANGRIVHANASGHAMLADGSMLSERAGRLVASEGDGARELGAILAAKSGGVGAVGVNGIAVPLMSGGGVRYVAHVLPLTSGLRRKAGANYAAVVALFVRKAELDTPSPPEVIAKTFKLTPSELRVLLAIVQVGGVPETAEALGVAEPTVKTHLQRVFAKTDTARQADLVKLVAGFSSPLAR